MSLGFGARKLGKEKVGFFFPQMKKWERVVNPKGVRGFPPQVFKGFKEHPRSVVLGRSPNRSRSQNPRPFFVGVKKPLGFPLLF